MIRYSELLDKGLTEPGRFSREQVEGLLKIAQRDLATSEKVLESAHEWAYAIAYNAMLQAGRAFMFQEGYRSRGEGHHLTVIKFLRAGLDPEFASTINVMDRMRRKRNRSMYDTSGAISLKEAGEAVVTARDFVGRICRILKFI
ncbi:MAG: HEPN domain-containing protein [bacterium]